MGIVAGTLFWQGSGVPQDVMGILFQSMFFVSLGAMRKVFGQFALRSIFYKQQDANFYQTSAYVLGRSIANIPSSIMDGVVYGTIVFWFVGLAHSDGASIANYFIFMLIILVMSFTAGLAFSIFSSLTRDRTIGQACVSIAIVFMVLFSGFTVSRHSVQFTVLEANTH